jgi:hypothetical protein
MKPDFTYISENVNGNLHDVARWANKKLEAGEEIVAINCVNGNLSVVLIKRKIS